MMSKDDEKVVARIMLHQIVMLNLTPMISKLPMSLFLTTKRNLSSKTISLSQYLMGLPLGFPNSIKTDMLQFVSLRTFLMGKNILLKLKKNKMKYTSILFHLILVPVKS